MSIAQSLLPEFDNEMAGTRRILACVPSGHDEFAPHEKSRPLGSLAVHLAFIPMWAVEAMTKTEFNLATDERGYEVPTFESAEQLLAHFDRAAAAARAAIAGGTDAQMMEPWTLRNGERVVFTLPRVAVLRSMVISHMIHHRAQLGVYLRMLDVPIPGVYGPSADEMAAMAAHA